MPTLLTHPPSLAKIYLRGALGFITKKHSLGQEVTRIPSSMTIPDEILKFQIDPDHVQKFNMVMNSTAGDSGRNSNAPTTTNVPIAYPQCLINGMPMNLMTHRFFPMNIVGSVHESTEILSHKPLILGEEGPLQARCHIVPEIERSDKLDWIFTVITTIGSDDNAEEKVMTITNQYRILNPQRNKVKLVENPAKPEPVDYENDPQWEPIATWNFPVDTGRRYALLNGDINPIHLFPITAKIFGYKSCIAHGMYSVCQLMNEPRFLDGTVKSVSARFTRPTFLPSPAVKAFWNPASATENGDGHEYVIGFRSEKDGQFKETVKGRIHLD